MKKTVNIKIDGAPIVAEEDTTVLDAARAHNVFVPTLCHYQGLTPVGACRMCIIEVKGVPRLLPACVTKVSEGMDVTSASPKVQKYRKMILELLLAERNHVCAVCVANGHCELQGLSQQLGVNSTRYPYRYPAYDVDASHERFIHDPNRCILCTRCVRACEEVEGARTWAVKGRGINSDITSDLDIPWGDSTTCTSCGKCVHSCPVGALTEKGKAAAEMVKHDKNLSYLESMRVSGR